MVFGPANAAPLGSSVENVATVGYRQGPNFIQQTTSPAIFTIEARRTPSTIDFFRIVTTAPDAIPTFLNGSDFDAGAGFVPVGPITLTSGLPLDLAGSKGVVDADNYFPGEPILIRVRDSGQNGDPAVIETLIATIETGNGDFIRLRLYESGPDTGDFFAYVQSTGSAADPSDNLLSIAPGASITARYQDPFDATEISTDIAGVDPFGRVFDSATGALLDGVQVSIVDNATGQPADVFGLDGVSPYPSTVITGSTVVDGSGFTYPLAPGEFRFPIMFPGDYRLIVEPTSGYTAPSAEPESALQTLPGAPFNLGPASFGGAFTLDGTGDVSFDVPLDPQTEIVVTKRALAPTAGIGDFVRYEVTVENRGANASRPRIEDKLPRGFRYQAGSARFNGARLGEPAISADGATLTFLTDPLDAGETARLVYVARIGPGARPGQAVNQATAVDASGAPVSNTAEATVEITDDFLRDQLTIVGRIAADACRPEDPWPRKTDGGAGVANIRLYTETGVSTLTDEDGLYHFEALTPGLHVVQVDETTIPKGYDLVRCEETTRFAGRAASQFVEGRGGSLMRANFYLARNAEYEAPEIASTPPAGESDLTEYQRYDQTWLDAQEMATRWAYPAEGSAPSIQSANVGFMHPANRRVTLLVNGQKAQGYNFAGRDVSSDRTKAITRWRGVDLLPGENEFTAIVTDMEGAEVDRVAKKVSFIDRVERASLDEAQSSLVADGRSEPVIAIRVTDGAGRAVRSGRMVNVIIEPPYRAADLQRLEDASPLDQPLSAVTAYPVANDGLVRIRLAPTSETGAATIRVRLDTGTEAPFTAYLKPALRDWIIVGLAEGSLARTKTTSGAPGAVDARDNLRDGRVAVFAKGAVKGDWLVTIAADTDKDRGDIDDELFDVVDPDDRYPLYGDRSQQQFEAQSRYPVFLKAEKEAFQALVGDFDTGLSEARLARYARRVTGGKTVYEGERFRFTGFTADTNQTLAREELAADGTSGPFRLSNAPLVRNSETLIIETRDRFRPDQIISTTPLARFADYDIDYTTGRIVLRLPVPATDEAFNNNVLVAEYETTAPVARGVTAGGRAAVRTDDGRAEFGVSLIRESAVGADNSPDASDAFLAGADLRLRLREGTEMRLEYAETHRDDNVADPAAPAETGSNRALLAEIEHVADNLQAKLLYQETGERFGLGQVSTGVAGVRRFGAEARYRFDEFQNEDATRRGERFVTAKAYREEALATGARRDLAEIGVSQETGVDAASVGLRWVDERPAGEAPRQTLMATAAARRTLPHIGLTVRASRDQPLTGDDEATLFPARTTVGFDQVLFDDLTLSVTHEIQDAANLKSANTIVGVTATPWTGGSITASADRLTQDSGERIGATLGVDQQVRLTDKWSASFGLTRREELREDGVVSPIDDIIPDQPLSPFDVDGAYTSFYSGVGYRGSVSTGSGRFEMRKSEEGQRYAWIAGAAREVSEELSFAGAARLTQENNDQAPDRRSGEARLGAAWRPRSSEALIVLDRLDFRIDEVDFEARNTRIVNNLALNTRVGERVELNLNHGLKYAWLETADADYTAWTQLLGAETRIDLASWLDIGLQGAALYSHGTGAVDYSYGPSIGVSPTDNVWFTIGYNVEGFDDPDFAASEWTRTGPFIRLRIKFDQHDARGLLDAISPDKTR